jgi:glyoxylase-like metal-dependent hydrolase (beta-lactamase superfamily II)
MATVIPFDRTFDSPPEQVAELSPLLRRITADNPSLFTFKGTNTYIVGRGTVAIVDPGPDLPAHTQAILDAVAGETVSHIIVTHTHMDHSPGVPALVAATGALTYGFGPHGAGVRRTWPFSSPEGGDTSFQPDRRIADGETIEGEGWTLQALHTPGHISNHLCFSLREENSLLSGDHVMGWSTSVVSPPDGDMADYMDSLKLLIGRPETIYWPGHGGPIRDPQPFVAAFIAHREEREVQILALLADGPQTIPAMVRTMYADVPETLHRAAARSVLSHLLRMVEDGRIAAEGEVGPDAFYRRR